MSKKNKVEDFGFYIISTIIISLGFIIYLFLFSAEIGGGGGGWIGGFGFDLRYDWGTNSTIALILFIFLFFIVGISYDCENQKLCSKFLTGIIIASILGMQIFYFVSPEFKFYFSGNEEPYRDSKGNFDTNKYIEAFGKYCKNEDGWRFLGDSKFNMCLYNGKIHNSLETVENYITMFDYAKNNDERELYYRLFLGAEKFGLKKIIEEYHDITFQAYLINFGSEIDFELFKKNIVDIEIEKLLIFSIEKKSEIKKNIGEWDSNEWRKFTSIFNKERIEVIKKIDGINLNVF